MTQATAQSIIHRLYRDILHRESDPSGLQVYTTALVTDGKDEAWLRELLQNSEERKILLSQEKASHPPLTNPLTQEAAQAIVRRLYRDILHRDPDPAGLQNHTTALVSQGKDEAWLREAFLNSPEHQTLRRWQARQPFAFGLSVFLALIGAFLARRTLGAALRYQRAFFVALALIPIVVYFGLIGYFAVNIPHGDDYDVFLAFLNLPTGKRLALSTLFAQANEHRIFFSRILAQTIYTLYGQLDFRLLAVIGNLSLIGIAVTLGSIARSCNLSLASFAPVVLILFLTQTYENMTWAAAAIQNNCVLFFALLSLVLWQRRSRLNLGLSLSAAALATYTNGSGLFIYIPLLLWAGLECLPREPDGTHFSQAGNSALRRLLVLVSSAGIVMCVYFWGYTHPSIGTLFANPWQVLQYFTAFLGGYLEPVGLALLAGVSALVVFLFFSWQHYFKQRPVLYFFLLYLFVLAGVAAVTRSQFGLEQAVSSRYRVIPLLIVGCSYLAWIDLCTKKGQAFRQILVPSAVAVFLFLNSFFLHKAILELHSLRQSLTAGIQAWSVTGAGLSYPDQERASRVLQTAIRSGVYRIPESIAAENREKENARTD